MIFIQQFIQEHWLQLIAPAIVFISLIYFGFSYGRHYHRPAKKLAKDLSAIAQQVKVAKERPSREKKLALANIFRDSPFAHNWNEYQETLHDQLEYHEGEARIKQTRATASASSFFSAQSIVDKPLQTEYFRHLPGILTGIGIIGTFFGLIIGLSHFELDSPEKVQKSVSALLNDVKFAFYGSCSSIIFAIAITYLEKSKLRICYHNLDELNDAIDAMFSAGVGEEYLASLVEASEESAAQTRMLKDSLVSDLREMLQNLVDSQVRENLKLGEVLTNSYRDAGHTMATQISESIEASFRAPLDKLAQSVASASGDQSGMVSSLLQEVLVAFMAKIESIFGKQLSGMGEMMSQSVTAMQTMQSGFAALIGELGTASESSTQAIQQQLSKTLQDMHTSQSQLQSSMNEMITNLQSGMQNMLGEFKRNKLEMDGQMHASQQELQRGTHEAMGVLSGQMQLLLESNEAERDASRKTIEDLKQQTGITLKDMQLGADKMRAAAERFETAGLNVSEASSSSAVLAGKLQASSGELAGASRELSGVLADYKVNRDSVGQAIAVLDGVIRDAKAEAGLRSQAMQDLKALSDRMHQINAETGEYLEQVHSVLGNSFDAFGAGIERTLSKTMGTLDSELDKAVKSLAGGISNLEESIEDLSDTLGKPVTPRR